jgi:hypothetical protein
MKTTQDIEQLLEKYFEGETSVAEEKALKTYFQQPTIAPHLEVYRELFGYFQVAQQIEYKPATAKVVTMNTARQGRHYKWWWQVAAVLAIGIALWCLIPQTYSSNAAVAVTIEWEAYETTDTEAAYEETLKALELLSEALGGGKQKVVKEMDNFAALKHALE